MFAFNNNNNNFCLRIMKIFSLSPGDPEPEITWFKNDVIIDDDDRNFRQEEEEDGTAALLIMEVMTLHRGTYKCMAKNKHGKATSSAELFVEGRSCCFLSV